MVDEIGVNLSSVVAGCGLYWIIWCSAALLVGACPNHIQQPNGLLGHPYQMSKKWDTSTDSQNNFLNYQYVVPCPFPCCIQFTHQNNIQQCSCLINKTRKIYKMRILCITNNDLISTVDRFSRQGKTFKAWSSTTTVSILVEHIVLNEQQFSDLYKSVQDGTLRREDLCNCTVDKLEIWSKTSDKWQTCWQTHGIMTYTPLFNFTYPALTSACFMLPCDNNWQFPNRFTTIFSLTNIRNDWQKNPLHSPINLVWSILIPAHVQFSHLLFMSNQQRSKWSLVWSKDPTKSGQHISYTDAHLRIYLLIWS